MHTDLTRFTGSGEFLLIDEKNPEKVHLVVRTINSSAFSSADWDEYVYEASFALSLGVRAVVLTLRA